MDKRSKRIVIATGVFLVLILVIDVAFHYRPGIIDALSLKIMPEFGIRIPVVRIVFEPVLGLLLFFNRSLYALTEVPVALGWLFIFYLVWMVWKGVSVREKKSKRRWFGGRLVDIPIVAGLLFTLFVVMIFIRLPNNTIVNGSENGILVTTHCHTEYSHDGLISEKSLWRWHKRNGFDAFFITDHNNHDRTLDFKMAQRKGEFPVEPLVMCGEEFSGSNHLSLLGLQRKFSTHGYSDSAAVAATHADDGAVIVNHWFDGEHKTLAYYRDLGVDGFEIENTAEDRYYPRDIYWKIRNFCEKNHLIMNGGLDFHGYGNVCSLWNDFTIPGWHRMDPVSKEKAILDVLRDHDQSRLKVLLYHDRPYYDKKNLNFRPFITLFDYFRTLNGWQIFSWFFWVLVAAWILIRRNIRNEDQRIFFTAKLIPATGVISALFLLSLALDFALRYGKVREYNTIFPEYARLFFYLGFSFLLYSALVLWLRLRKRKK